MRQSWFLFDIGIGAPYYLAHMTIGIGSRRTLWLNLVSTNWNKIDAGRRYGDYTGCFSIFTFAYTVSPKWSEIDHKKGK